MRSSTSYRRSTRLRPYINKEPLRRAFEDLRKAGYFARQNWKCCQSCGWAAVPGDKSDYVVFYHHQDNDRLKYDGKCRLAWAGDGHFICEILRSHGIKVNWDGSPDTRIEISLREDEEEVCD